VEQGDLLREVPERVELLREMLDGRVQLRNLGIDALRKLLRYYLTLNRGRPDPIARRLRRPGFDRGEPVTQLFDARVQFVQVARRRRR
jgi:hypothetical protein